MSLATDYLALILVIVLWVSVWALADTIGKLYLKTHQDRIRFYVVVAIVVSAILLKFFPQHLFL
jgi:uncharacterized membrane-anchored protein